MRIWWLDVSKVQECMETRGLQGKHELCLLFSLLAHAGLFHERACFVGPSYFLDLCYTYQKTI